MALHENVQALCEKAGITVSSLERELGYVRGTIARWDKHSPSVERVKEVADALCVTVDALMRGKSDE